MYFLRADGIPAWVTILAVLFGLLSTVVGISVVLYPGTALAGLGIEYTDGAAGLALTWAGRNAGLGIVLLVAVYLRNASGYAVAFAGTFLREASDILHYFSVNAGMLISVGISLLLVEIVCFVISFRAARQQS
jgi:hypothetical protein